VFSVAFPFFGNVDEPSHFDLVCKYSRGHVPTGLEPWDRDAAELILLYGSPEYFEPAAAAHPGSSRGPRRPESVGERAAFEREVASWAATENHESTQPPLYYLIAGAWYRVGAWIGLNGLWALYWTRSLNVVACGVLTWLAYVFARTAFPSSAFLRLGVPLLVAFFPQDAFYTIGNDVLLPVFGGAAFLGLLSLVRGEHRRLASHAGTGLLVAGTFLVKFSGVALLPVAAGMAGFAALRRRGGERRAALVDGAVMLAAAAVPIAVWCLYNALVVGDVTASAEKVRLLGWTPKPWATMFDHPIFSPSGVVTFWSQTLTTFWRGELVWGLKRLASPAWDLFYSVSSLAFVAASLVAPWSFKLESGLDEPPMRWSGLVLFVLSLAFLASISVMYDFGECFYPSRAMPYLTSGRLALSALLPFAALYVSGLDAVLPPRVPAAVRWTLLIGLVALMTFFEWQMSRVAFASAFNGFHAL